MTRQMHQPTKDALRDQLALAADEIIRLRSERVEPPAIGLVFALGGFAGVLLGWLASLGWLG